MFFFSFERLLFAYALVLCSGLSFVLLVSISIIKIVVHLWLLSVFLVDNSEHIAFHLEPVIVCVLLWSRKWRLIEIEVKASYMRRINFIKLYEFAPIGAHPPFTIGNQILPLSYNYLYLLLHFLILNKTQTAL